MNDDDPYNVNAINTNGSTFSSTRGTDGEGDAFSATLLGATQAFHSSGRKAKIDDANFIDDDRSHEHPSMKVQQCRCDNHDK